MHSLYEARSVEPMVKSKFLYTFTYDKYETELAKLEAHKLFGEEDDHKLLWSDKEIEPSLSAFIKQRLQVFARHEDYSTLLKLIKGLHLEVEGFKVEYLVLEGDSTDYTDRLSKLKDIGYSIVGDPDYYKPKLTYTLCFYQSKWCFGQMHKDKFDWYKHTNKPCSYSNSISPNIAKALVNIATKGNKEMTILDACCGVGTIMLEGCFAAYNVEGCDINWKVCRNARKNLAHFNYKATVYRTDIKDIDKCYDTAIIDLPYNLLSQATEETTAHIIQSASDITNQVVIVSTSDISNLIHETGLVITDTCRVGKRGKTVFERQVWVCEGLEG